MSKIYKLKRWLTLEDAAMHLARSLGEEVSVSDLLQLAVDGRLVLSVELVNHATANIGKLVPLEQAAFSVFPSLRSDATDALRDLSVSAEGLSDAEARRAWFAENGERLRELGAFLALRGDAISADAVLEWDTAITSIRGLWDIPNFGGAQLDLVHLLQNAVGGPEVTLTSLDGTVLVSSDGDRYARLLEHMSDNPYAIDREDRSRYPYGDPNSYYPRGGLPDDILMVVRTESINGFLSSLEEGGSVEKDIGTREKAGLLRMIAGLAKEAGIDLLSDKAAVQIEAAAGQFQGPSEKTIRKHLKAIRTEILGM
jgi:hypothetical protein